MCVILHKREEGILENLNIIVATNLKKIREERKLSLDNVAQMTGVSKSMLGQIERGESNPTVTTVWKIANGLKISFTELIKTTQESTVIIQKENVEPLIEDNGKYRLYPFFPYESEREFEMYSVEIEKGGYLSADSHGEGTEEFITVFDGELTLRVDNEEFTVKQGDSIRFRADKPHIYHNSGETLTRVSMVIYYSRFYNK
jgi:XRE family transcriptional regulator, regulator of sulfur utilization